MIYFISRYTPLYSICIDFRSGFLAGGEIDLFGFLFFFSHFLTTLLMMDDWDFHVCIYVSL